MKPPVIRRFTIRRRPWKVAPWWGLVDRQRPLQFFAFGAFAEAIAFVDEMLRRERAEEATTQETVS